jgi:hypothetical protein
MIKNINSPDMQVTISGQPGPYHSGHVMWDGNRQVFRVIDNQGVSQDMHGATVNISAGSVFLEMQSWYMQKRAEEAELKRLCAEYPNLEEARKEFEMLKQLVKEFR